jgi:hypothetical protein
MLLYFASEPVKCNFLEYDMPYGRKEESKKRQEKKGGSMHRRRPALAGGPSRAGIFQFLSHGCILHIVENSVS